MKVDLTLKAPCWEERRPRRKRRFMTGQKRSLPLTREAFATSVMQKIERKQKGDRVIEYAASLLNWKIGDNPIQLTTID